MGRQRNNLKYAIVGHIPGEFGSRSVGGRVTDRHNSPFYRGRRPGGPEPGGRARTSVAGGPGRLAAGLPSVRPGCCPGPRQRGPLRIVGAPPPGQGGTRRRRAVDAAAGGQGRGRVSGPCPLTVPDGPTGGRPVWRPRPPTWGAAWRPPPRCGESSRGSGPQGEAERARGRGPCRHSELIIRGVGGGHTGRPSTTGLHRSLQRYSS